MKITGVIFDADGTLFDSMPFWENVADEYLKNQGVNTTPEYRDIVKTMYLEQAVDYILENYPVTATKEKILEDMFEIIGNAYRNEIETKEGVKGFLVYLHAKGVKMCIATSSEREMIESAVKNTGLSEYFEFIITSSEVGIGKSSPEIYNRALKKLGTDKRTTVIFEDSLYAAQTAKNAEFNVCGIYDTHEKEQNELREVSDIYIDNFTQAEKFFK